ncbi:OLC1v1008427C1 [Oldenlandia corymbosa var. corymbosa]|uniref:OLC1v1008427C1 n=1 Tax=Oldenlandia corymbosa var. corymbosa TaxID=529605 RepID=A0AAV1DLM6_OLDCO|nr:OLC1v1008427C1 [Oldenlandia corymbosa var. corymbosa]
MAIKLLIVTFLVCALNVAGARTKASPPTPRNGTISPPPPPPPRNGTVSPPPPVAGGGPTNCSDELVVFSNCLSYISSSPNNTTTKPSLLGFPVNSTKILSLSSRCPVIDHGTKANFSIKALCSGVHTLPPLSSIIPIALNHAFQVLHPYPQSHRSLCGNALGIFMCAIDASSSSPVNRSLLPPGMNLTQESTASSGTRGHADNQSDISNQGHADREEHPAPAFQVFPAWRTFSINKADANPAGFPLSWCLFGHVVASIFTGLYVAY